MASRGAAQGQRNPNVRELVSWSQSQKSVHQPKARPSESSDNEPNRKGTPVGVVRPAQVQGKATMRGGDADHGEVVRQGLQRPLDGPI